MGALVLGQFVTLGAQCAYVFAFREAFDRQTAVLRERPGRCVGWGFALAAFWTLLGYGAFHIAAANRSPWLLTLLSVPLFLATTAGAAVCLSTVVARLLKQDVTQRTYLWLAIGQLCAFALSKVPYLGVPVTTLYACAGIGAIALAEYEAGKDGRALPRLGLAGLASMIVLTAAISAGIVSAGRRMSQVPNAALPDGPPPPPPAAPR